MLKIGSLFSGYGGLDIAVAKQFDAELALRLLMEGVE
jgi:hypothetical protein